MDYRFMTISCWMPAPYRMARSYISNDIPKYRDKEGVSHMVQEQLEEIRQNIRNACERSGRKVEDVTLIAVSKTKPVPMLQEAYDAGARDFGENKVQEILEKEPQLPSDIRWHMIGHLQRNKVKYIVGNVTMIHSVDSLRLAEEISKESVKKGCLHREF